MGNDQVGVNVAMQTCSRAAPASNIEQDTGVSNRCSDVFSPLLRNENSGTVRASAVNISQASCEILFFFFLSTILLFEAIQAEILIK